MPIRPAGRIDPEVTSSSRPAERSLLNGKGVVGDREGSNVIVTSEAMGTPATSPRRFAPRMTMANGQTCGCPASSMRIGQSRAGSAMNADLLLAAFPTLRTHWPIRYGRIGESRIVAMGVSMPSSKMSRCGLACKASAITSPSSGALFPSSCLLILLARPLSATLAFSPRPLIPGALAFAGGRGFVP